MGRKKRNRYLLLLGASFLLSLAFAPYNLGFISYVALIPLFEFIENNSPKKAFLVSWGFGAFFSMFLLWWLAFLDFPLPQGLRFLLWTGVLVLFLYLGFFYGIFGYLIKRFSLWIAPFVIAGIEYIKELTDLGFPWGSLGYTQVKYPVFFQLASVFGVGGVSSWIVLVNIILYKLYKTRDYKKWGIITGIVFAIPLVYGIVRLSFPLKKTLQIGIIQPNIPGDLKGTRRVYDSLTNAMFQQARRVKGVSLIVFPETGTLVDLTQDKRYRKRYMKLCEELDASIIAGMPYWEYEGYRYVFYNTAVMVDKKGIRNIYKKIRLAPFGEMIPFDDKIPFLREIELGGGHFGRGKKFTVFKLKKHGFGVLICFESIFPELSRNFVKKGADVLVNITNDGWFRRTPGTHQHAEIIIARAVENGVSVIRVANNGPSFAVSPKGIIENPTGFFKIEETKTYVYKRIFAFFPSWGHFYRKICGIGTGGVLLWALLLNFLRKKPKRKPRTRHRRR